MIWFFSRNSYEGGKEKGLYEGYGKATYIGGHSYVVRTLTNVSLISFII